MKYTDKLKDPRWQKKRLEIFSRDNWTCQSCGSKSETLCVHHFQYHGNPWEAENEDLITLCEDCHKEETDYRLGAEQQLIYWLRRRHFLGCDLGEIVNGLENFEKNPKITSYDLSVILSMILMNSRIQKDLYNKEFADIPEQQID